MSLKRLPVDEILPEVLRALEARPSLVLQAAPGTGKTTRVPPALLKAPFLDPRKEILVLEPRRLAAKMSARRVAQEMGEGVGQTVGYQFRFENMTSAATRLRFITEGMLMRRLIGDPQLKTVSAVVLDEFHERHLHSDVSLAFLRWLQRTGRPDLRIIVMSATLDTQSLATYLGEPGQPANVLRIDAKQFEVTHEYLAQAPAKHLDQTVKDAVAAMLSKTPGDLLVFLPGMGEIRRAESALAPLAERYGLTIAPLHGELSREEQDAAIEPGPSRKVILSTNVAETSLTIEGVTGVIDSGLHRIASHSWWSGVPALRTRPISRASAIQRAGRAGRTAPGHCLRLYTRGDFDSRPPFETPEIQRADLTQTLLELKALGIKDAKTFPWFESPSAQAFEASHTLLYRLGALSSPETSSTLTELGRRLAGLPAHPRIARMLIAAEALDVLEEAASLAATVMESRLDNLDALAFMQKARMTDAAPHRGASMDQSVWRVRSHLLTAFTSKNKTTSKSNSESKLSKEDRLRYSILCGFPDRVARIRPGQDPNATQLEILFSSGGSTRVENGSAISGSQYFVILDLQERQGIGQTRTTTQVQALCTIREEWLFDLEPTLLSETREVAWNDSRKRVSLSEKLTYGELTLDETLKDLSAATDGTSPMDAGFRENVASVLLKATLGVDAARLRTLSPHDVVQTLAPIVEPEVLDSLLARMTLVAKYFPETQLPDLVQTPSLASQLVLRACGTRSSLAELKEIDWTTEILAACGELNAYQLEEYAPTTITLASGRKPKVHYSLSAAPWLESRLQDFLGMKKGPSILKNRLLLTLHLLAPNYRALQVTTDLEGFWQRVYPELRHQLSRRYPRHSWPENP